MKKDTLQKLKDYFKLNDITVEEWRDKYGKLISLKEVGLTCYKRDIDTEVPALIERHKFATSKLALTYLKQISKIDNEHAEFLGLRKYEVVRVEMTNDAFLGFGVLIRFKDNGEKRRFLETGLVYALNSEERMKEYVERAKTAHYFTAGGLEVNDVDFLFKGVGHSSKKEMYTYTPLAI